MSTSSISRRSRDLLQVHGAHSGTKLEHVLVLGAMRFTYAEAMTQATYYAPLAQAAEAAGYTSMTVADSLIYPQESDSKYPYTDTGDREFLEDKEFIETMVLLRAPRSR